ncbi:ribosomal protein L6, alpha-beta domain-containing protein [Vararia minispora EC-137]|uniref:Ribosomal protein L6, alpha-beta domain-containing protein n=1 Tax=Vararia minispora EC-137 TaxID=1314806 RepID=A0ACB8QS18_9AGAM|nr:ribosomal protein L6, alpha-beta domain-containing protein [Vararia minispora EC-137]
MSMLASSSRAVSQLARTGRAFGTSAVARKDNIGKVPIPYPSSVSFEQLPDALAVTGPLGTTNVPLKRYMLISYPELNKLAIAVEDRDIKEQRSMWGLTRSLIANAITGMTEGFTVPLFLVGVGYRAAIEDDPRFPGKQRLNMKLGYSHPVFVPIPDHIKVEVPIPTKISLFCLDKHKLGLFAAAVREWRKPEPFKGKGIFVGNETIRIKAVKKK